jgi:hypothetical protein
VAKRAFTEIEELPLRVGYELEQRRSVELSDQPDGDEAIRMFREGAVEPHSWSRPFTAFALHSRPF